MRGTAFGRGSLLQRTPPMYMSKRIYMVRRAALELPLTA